MKAWNCDLVLFARIHESVPHETDGVCVEVISRTKRLGEVSEESKWLTTVPACLDWAATKGVAFTEKV